MKCLINRGDSAASLVAKAGAYRLLRIMYLALPAADVKATILAPFGGNAVSVNSCLAACPGEVHQSIPANVVGIVRPLEATALFK